MAEKGTQDPTTGTESDISKAQAQQQPPNQAKQQPESGRQGQDEFAQDREREAGGQLQGDTLAEKRTDIEGASLRTPEKGEAESGFVGSEGEQDSSSELVEDEDKEGFVPEGK
jgi:hypothetical protein